MSLLIKDLSFSNSPTLELSPTWIFKQWRSRTRQPLASSISGLFFLQFSRTLEIPEQDTLSCLLILRLPRVHTPSQPPRGSIQRSSSDPNLSGLVPFAVVPGQTLPTAPPSRHRLTVRYNLTPAGYLGSNPLFSY